MIHRAVAFLVTVLCASSALAGHLRQPVPVGNAPILGPKDAPVTIVVYMDYECPFCRRLMPKLWAMVQRHPRDVRLVVKNFPLPFHRHALQAAVAAVEAQVQGKFWSFHRALIGQPRRPSNAALLKAAKRAGLDMRRFARALSDPKVRQRYRLRVLAEKAEGRRFGVSGTPTTFVNGRRIVGMNASAILAAVGEELRLARKYLAEHKTTRTGYYHFILEQTLRLPKNLDRIAQWARLKPRPGLTLEAHPTLGPPDAPILVVWFTNPLCYGVSRTLAALGDLMATHLGQIRVVVKFLSKANPRALYPKAALLGALAAKQGKFWAFLARLADSRPRGAGQLLEAAEQAGLHEPAQAMGPKGPWKFVERDLAEAEALGIWSPGSGRCSTVWIPGSKPLSWISTRSLSASVRMALSALDRTPPGWRIFP